MRRCKHSHVESSWSTSYNEEEKRDEEYDIKDGVAQSKKGVWAKSWPGPICNRFYNKDVEEQFKKNGGFFFCDESRCNECEFYEADDDSKEVRVKNKRNPICSRLRHEVFKKDNFRCKECGATNKEKTLHVDHILPVSQGGSDELDNLQTLCDECNLAKSNKSFNGGI